MGLLQKAVETYDNFAYLAGVEREGHAVLAPIGHITTNANIEITLDINGTFIDARVVDKTEPKIIIPVTEDSGGRTSKPCAHPFCEQISYLSGENDEKYSLYVEQLEKWADSVYSHPFVKAVLIYLRKKEIVEDLSKKGIKISDEKQLVRWRIVGGESTNSACWENRELFNRFSAWYCSTQNTDSADCCMITGETAILAKQHSKGIIAMNGNAKLISSNDTSNFTYRGRFTDDKQAATISYIASQKAHNALRWISAEQGASLVFGGRTFLCWNPKGKKLPHPANRFSKKTSTPTTPSDYKKELKETLSGFKSELPENSSDVVIAAFDAATTGRLSLTYYNELQASDFLLRLYDWDEHCCWWKYDSKQKIVYISQPLLFDIVKCAFGTQRTEKKQAKLVTDDRILKQQMQRLISCRVDKAQFPLDIETALVNRASTPQAFDHWVYEEILFTACAAIKKYCYDRFKEDWEMSLEKDREDCSYQFGRLLAVMEKAERDTYSSDESREPNAVKLQSVFRRNPLHTANIIEEQLKRAYFPRLPVKSRIFYNGLIGEILEKISNFPDELNKPLKDSYLMGYYLQRNELYKKNKENNQEEK